MARWKFGQVSYIGDKLYQQDEEADLPSSFNKPGPHWKPIDDDAKAIMAAAGQEYTGEVPDVIAQLRPMFEEAATKMQVAGGAIDTGALKAAFRDALAEVLDPGKRDQAFKDAVAAEVKSQIDAIRAKGGKKAEDKDGA